MTCPLVAFLETLLFLTIDGLGIFKAEGGAVLVEVVEMGVDGGGEVLSGEFSLDFLVDV